MAYEQLVRRSTEFAGSCSTRRFLPIPLAVRSKIRDDKAAAGLAFRSFQWLVLLLCSF